MCANLTINGGEEQSKNNAENKLERDMRYIFSVEWILATLGR